MRRSRLEILRFLANRGVLGGYLGGLNAPRQWLEENGLICKKLYSGIYIITDKGLTALKENDQSVR